jgi:hypothetical protein
LRKVIIIAVILAFGAGCSVSRRQTTKNKISGEAPDVGIICQSLLDQNITDRSFYIERAEFTVRSSEGEKSGLGTVKFLMPDKFLISLKSHGGIEFARIFLTGDSIMVNDRFNKRLFYGSASYLKNKYGLTTSILPVVLGDYENDEKLDCSKARCEENKWNVNGTVKGLRINYVVDCVLGKTILAIPEDRWNESLLQISYSDFLISDNISIPGRIEIKEIESNTTIEIQIKKIVLPWDGSIEFIPGKQYEKILLQ